MKKVIVSLAVLAQVVVAGNVFAGGNNNNDKNATLPIAVLSNDDEALYIKVDASVIDSKRPTLVITDANGDELFRKTYNKANAIQNVKLLKENATSNLVYVTLRNEDGKISKTYTVSTKTQVAEQVEVAAL